MSTAVDPPFISKHFDDARRSPAPSMRTSMAVNPFDLWLILTVDGDSVISRLLKYHAVSLVYCGDVQRLQYTHNIVYMYMYITIYIYIYICISDIDKQRTDVDMLLSTGTPPPQRTFKPRVETLTASPGGPSNERWKHCSNTF